MGGRNVTRPPTAMRPFETDTNMARFISSDHEGKTSAVTSISAIPARTGPNATSAVYKLPDELLDQILKQLVRESPRLRPLYERDSLSTESFVSAPPNVPEDAIYLNNFRRVCSRFFHAGRSRLFARETIRFSMQSFERIRVIAEYPKNQLVPCEVQKISYMVHDLYPQNEIRLQEILNDIMLSMANCQQRLNEIQASHVNPTAQSRIAALRLDAEIVRCRRNEKTIRGVMARAKEQGSIIQGKVDEKSLTIALSKFTRLQQIRLMRNVDGLDRDWTSFLSSQPALREEFGMSQWTHACEHATEVMGRAYFTSRSMANRLSSRFMDPRPPWLQRHMTEAKILWLSTRLTCLELQIGDPADLNQKMNDLSSVFSALFHAAKKMQGLHIGLLREASIPLESIFHNVSWANLQYIGFSRWNLHSDEIVNFLDRHRGSLKSVRLREVKLKQGSWIDVLKYLRRNTKLKWVSFRQVGYYPSIGGGPIPERWPPPPPLGGFAMLRGPPTDDDDEYYSSEGSDDIGEHVTTNNGGETSVSEDDESEVDNNDSDETVEAVVATSGSVTNFDDEVASSSNTHDNSGSLYEADYDGDEDERESTSSSIAGDSEGGFVNELALDDRMMVQHASATDDRLPTCHCLDGLSWNDLEDDCGLDPTKVQWKKWERWAVRGCKEHDPATP